MQNILLLILGFGGEEMLIFILLRGDGAFCCGVMGLRGIRVHDQRVGGTCLNLPARSEP